MRCTPALLLHLLIALGIAGPSATAEELLYGAEGNRLRRYDVDSLGASASRGEALVEEVLIRNASEDETGDPDLARGRDINGTICTLPDGRFVAGEDTGQPSPPAGWGIFAPDGTQVGKLTATYLHGSPEPFGCALHPDGRLFTTSVGAQGLGGTPNGQLIVWFPPFEGFPGPPGAYPATDATSSNFCKIATDIGTAGEVAIDSAGNVYVSATGALQVLRFEPPFPTGPDAAGGCSGIDPTGAPLADAVQRSVFLDSQSGLGLATYSGLAITGSGPEERLVAASVLTGRIGEFDLSGSLVRELLSNPQPFGQLPTPFGNPQGIAVGADGTIYYADLDLVGTLPAVGPGPDGKLRRIRFDTDGEPLPPEVVRTGLRFPDSVTVLPGDLEALEWRTYAGSAERRFFQPREGTITNANVDELAIRWRFLTDAVITGSPTVAQVDVPGLGLTRVVYFVSWDLNIYALRLADGMELWRFATDPQPGASFPAAASVHVARVDDEDRVLVGVGETFYALAAATGTERWRFVAGTGCRDADGAPPGLCGFAGERNQIESSAIMADGRLFFGMDVNDVSTGKGGVFAVDAVEGTLAWYFDLETANTCRPDAGDAVRRFDGYHSEEQLGLPPGFLASREGCGFDRTPTGCGNVWSSPAADFERQLFVIASSNCDTPFDPQLGDYLPMPDYDEAIFALGFDGTPRWHWRPREVDPDDLAFGAVPNLFTVDDEGTLRDVAGVGSKDGSYYVVDRETGELVWERNVVDGGDIGGVIATAAVDVAERRIYFSTAPGESSENSPPFDPPQRPTIHALDMDTGEVVWDDGVAGDAPPSFAPTSGIPGVIFTGSVVGARSRFTDTEDDAGLPLGSFDLSNFGLASAPVFIDGTMLIGGGIGTLTQSGSSPGDFSAAVDSRLAALCVPGTPGCAACDDGLDNDGDGAIDAADDDGCVDRADDSEVLGDLDFDGDVDERDARLAIEAFGRARHETRFLPAADFDGDDLVTLPDYQAFIAAQRAYELASRQTAVPQCGLVGLELLPLLALARARRRRLAALLASLALLGADPAGAASTVRAVGPAAAVDVGEAFTLELRADLDAPILGWGLDLLLAPGLALVSGPAIGSDWSAAFAPDGDGLAGLAFPSGVQGDDVLLATLTLEATRGGLLGFEPGRSGDDPSEGLALDPVGFDDTSFVGGAVQVVPEPGTGALLGLGLAGLATRRLRPPSGAARPPSRRARR